MTKGEAFDKAWRRAIQQGDFALYDEIVHPDYESVNHGVKLDKNTSKRVLLKRKGKVIMAPYEGFARMMNSCVFSGFQESISVCTSQYCLACIISLGK